LVEEDTMRQVVGELCRVARDRIVLTIRLGEQYVLKSNTATHDNRKFHALIRRYGWRVAEDVPVLKKGWHVLRLERSK
jgi:hypothetical protein